MLKFFTALWLLAGIAASAAAQHVVFVGVPSEMDTTTSNSVLSAILELILNADDGTRIQVFDALNMQQVSDFTIPPIPGNSNTKVRVVRLKTQISDLKAYFMRSASVRSGKASQIKVPQFLELVGSGIKSSSGDTSVLLFGSPYYSDSRDAAFVFGKGYFPSDGHVLTSSRQSVFGTSDKKDLLKGATVHFCHVTDEFETELERAAVRRLWKVYCDGVGAVLATFGPSGEVTVERCLKNVTDAVSQDLVNPKDTIIEMRKAGEDLKRRHISVDADGGDIEPQDLSEPRSSLRRPPEGGIIHEDVETALRSAPKPKPGSLVIAAAWLAQGNSGTADVDLYVCPRRKADELNFNHTVSAEGRYLRDIREATRSLNDQTWGASWEAVEFEVAQLADTTCWLNLYRGCGGKIEGVVRIVYNGRTASAPFTFPAIAGDGAAGRGNRASNPCWIEIRFDELRWTRVR